MRTFVAVLVALQQTAPASRVTVEVAGMKHAQGQVGCMVFHAPDGFPNEPAKADARCLSPITDGGSRCEFSGARAGWVAVACFHDENGNGVLDQGWFGIPTEPWVVSRRAKGRLGPPAFEDARMPYDGGVMHLVLPVEG